ncbi:hypothetical protein B0H17DRAFT_1201370 [Mycena rosella]|uniref:DUF6533 domain-containing protein n=1 Tax=Mycena rosella TaxID=1033263 RepID=A0AAD7DJJ5_MYCRO|nr:hypothetical protein B0H17DRAFT_1201370 [Mycena rosella]
MASPPPPTPAQAEIDELILLVQDSKTTSYFAIAALSFLIYDHILSLDHEIEFIWKRRKSLASYVYIWFEGVSSTLIIATVDVILLMRVWILFAKSSRLLYILAPMMLVEIGIMFFIAAFTILHSNQYVHIGPILPGCYSTTVPKYFTLYPVPSLVVTFTMFILTVYNCTMRLGLSFTSRNAMPLVNLFLRDGVYWFLAVVAVNPPQIIIWAVARPTLTEILIIPSIVVYSIIGSRVLLNIMEIMAIGVVHHQIVTV